MLHASISNSQMIAGHKLVHRS